MELIMSNCKTLKSIEHFSTAKREGFVIPNEYANILISTADLTKKAIAKKYIKDAASLENIYELCPNSTYGYATNYPNLEVAKNKYTEIMVKCGLITLNKPEPVIARQK